MPQTNAIAIDNEVEYRPSWLTVARRTLGDAPAWLVSLAVHVAILLVLSLCMYSTSENDLFVIDSALEEVDSAVALDATATDQIGSQSENDTLTAAAEIATVRGESRPETVQRKIEEVITPEITPVIDEIALPSEAEQVAFVSTQGAAVTDRPEGGTAGAIDRLTLEIHAALKQRKMLVVWMFDASLSLKARRELIADRFENVYKQLDALEVTGDRALLTAVLSYGSTVDLLTKEPIDNVREVIQKVRTIKNDETGKELVFAALERAYAAFNPIRQSQKRGMMIIIVTDERGDDAEASMETTIAKLRRAGIRTYVVGNASPFGQRYGYYTWKYDDGGTEEIPIDQGPESFYEEILQLPFWGTNGNDLSRLTAGYGSYALTRVCAETGGMYLIAEDLARGPLFNQDTMRAYAPDYRPIRDIQKDLQANRAKSALWEAARQTYVTALPVPQLVFPAENDTVLRTALTEAQRPAAELDARLSAMADLLTSGEKDREKIHELRWQASYDLAMGRVLAMRARVFGYNAILAEMKLQPKAFSSKSSNQWRLVPSKEINAGAGVKKLADKAAMYLKRVVDKHPGTPWALIAERELSTPMGWAWKESIDPVVQMRQRAATDPEVALLLAEEERKQRERQKMRPPERKRPSL